MRAADLVLTNGEVHTLGDPDRVAEGVAVRDGEIVRVDREYELQFLVGVETRVVDLEGRVVLPGFVDAHTHLGTVGRRLVHADLAGATGPDDAVARLRDAAADRGWLLGFGFDESTWEESRLLTRDDLDAVSEERPVAAFREDMHTVVVNGVALDRYADDFPDGDVRTEGGTPTGVLVEDAAGVIQEAIAPDRADTREYLRAAQAEANRLGVTGVHEMVRRSHAPAAYRDLELDGALTLRVRLNYWSDHLDAAVETGLRTNHGSEFVRTGAIKTFTDGSIGSRTAKVSDPFADEGAGDAADDRGKWVVPPAELEALVSKADAAGFQVAVHAIGDEAIEATLDAYAALDDPGAARHRIEHLELATDEQIERVADLGVIASMQPNFHRWAGEGGFYERRLGARRTANSNAFAAFEDAGARLAFGSDCMPLDPLYGVHQAVNAPTERQRLPVTDALRAYTAGGAYAGFDEGRLGAIEVGKAADVVALERSPWDHPGEIDEIDVALTVVDGEIVYDGRAE